MKYIKIIYIVIGLAFPPNCLMATTSLYENYMQMNPPVLEDDWHVHDHLRV